MKPPATARSAHASAGAPEKRSFDDWLAAEAEAREDAGLTRRLVDSDQAGPWGEPLLDLAGNDYLGLARDPRVIAGAVRAAQEYGAGAGASRLVSGTLSIHTELERSGQLPR